MSRALTTSSGTILLLVGAVLVGIAIALDGAIAKGINGVGGICWFAGAAVLLVVAVRARPSNMMWVGLIAVTLTVAFVVKPSDWMMALIGFVPAGIVMASLAARNRILWATLVAAWYLPAHIGTAVGKAAVRAALGHDAPLRTDPPPTAAIVPLLIVVSALVGGLLATRLWARQDQMVTSARIPGAHQLSKPQD